MTPLEAVLSRLEAVKEVPSGYLARCPAHNDRNPSLSIREADDGKVLLRCWAGCKTADILAALGLRWSDLFASDAARRLGGPKGGHR
jgi:hypothetical protein